ncbi:MAG TPA: hypothetical protein VFG68_16830 [Fimbriiglobus sp.]|nr:hypothetical protein [Fimbriiglobus sp.]
MDSPLIHDRGRGPELVGTRITIYNLVPAFLNPDTTEQQVCEWYHLTPAQVAAMRAYFLHHYAEVMAENARIEERIRRGIEEQNSSPVFRAWANEVEGRVEYYPTWLAMRRAEAENGGPPLPANGPERLSEYVRWWRVHGASVRSGAAR